MNNTIKFEGLDDDLLTGYAPKGKVRDAHGRPFPRSMLLSVAKAGGAKVWRASRGTARDLVKLDCALKDAGGGGLRLIEVVRDVRKQAEGRKKYIRWLQAGRPEPGTRAYKPGEMKTAYVAAPGESNHGWGGAFDDDIMTITFTRGGKRIDGDEALSIYWEIARGYGFTPVIKTPRIRQPEAWHFDHLGPLAAVQRMFYGHRNDSPAYRKVAGLTAMVGNVLAGVYPGDRGLARLVQARLLIAGQWCGIPDGYLGKMTMAALEVALDGKLGSVTRKTPPSVILGVLDNDGVGLKEIAAA